MYVYADTADKTIWVKKELSRSQYANVQSRSLFDNGKTQVKPMIIFDEKERGSHLDKRYHIIKSNSTYMYVHAYKFIATL